MKYLNLLFATLFFTFAAQGYCQIKGNMPETWNLIKALQPVKADNIFLDDPQHVVWCGSVIKCADKYYMFYSRWLKAEGHLAWITHSEVAIAVSDKPGGPYKHVKVALPARGVDYWDGTTTHNPYVTEYDGKYYLYYIGTMAFIKAKQPLDYNPEWYTFRNGQRIGVAVATDILGDWQRFDSPILTNSPDPKAYDAMLVSNPAITIDPKSGKSVMLYKQVSKNGTFAGGTVRFGVAFADSPLGEFVKYKEPIFEKRTNDGKAWMVAEDPFVWQQGGKYYAIMRDVQGEFAGEKGGLAMMMSDDAINWTPTPFPAVMGRGFKFADGTESPYCVERPWLIFEKGKAAYLFGAVGFDIARQESGNVAFELK